MQTATLALELSADPSWLAVAAGGEVTERQFEGERGRALLPEIDALLHLTGVERAALGLVVAGTGPGSYTGLRIACSAALALGYALGVPAGGLPSFAAAALAAPPGREVHLLADAFRQEAYHAVYLRTGAGVEERVAPRILPAQAAMEAVPAGALLLAKPRWCREGIELLAPGVLPRASQLLELLAQAAAASGRQPAECLGPAQPLYLRAAARRPAAGT